MTRLVSLGFRTLLAALAAAAVIGLWIVFTGGSSTVGQVLGSVLVLGGGVLLALPAVLARWVPVRIGIAVLAGVGAILIWVAIWMPDGEVVPEWIGRAAAMITVLLVITAVALVLHHLTASARLTAARYVTYTSDVTGLMMLGMAWAMILTGGDAGVPARAIAGVAIIYVTSALGALVMAVMRSYTIVRRD